MTRSVRTILSTIFLPLVALGAACSDQPAGTEPGVRLLAKPNPNDCQAFAPLSITFAGAAGDALAGDGVGAYVEGSVGAHLNGPTGNLMLWTSQYGTTTRFVKATTAAGVFNTKDRIYTNSTTDNSGNALTCGLASIGVAGGKVVLEAELEIDGTDNGIIRYGKNCAGTVTGTKANVTWDGTSWTITATSGNYCAKSGRKYVYHSMAGGFSMTLSPAP